MSALERPGHCAGVQSSTGSRPHSRPYRVNRPQAAGGHRLLWRGTVRVPRTLYPLSIYRSRASRRTFLAVESSRRAGRRCWRRRRGAADQHRPLPSRKSGVDSRV